MSQIFSIVQASPPDDELVEQLEFLLGAAKKGELQNFVACFQHDDRTRMVLSGSLNIRLVLATLLQTSVIDDFKV